MKRLTRIADQFDQTHQPKQPEPQDTKPLSAAKMMAAYKAQKRKEKRKYG